MMKLLGTLLCFVQFLIFPTGRLPVVFDFLEPDTIWVVIPQLPEKSLLQ